MSKPRSTSNTAWMKSAPCKGMTRLFYPPNNVEGMEVRLRRESAAKSICSRCVYIEECLNYALINNEDGIWGGLTEGERKRNVTPRVVDVSTPQIQGSYIATVHEQPINTAS